MKSEGEMKTKIFSFLIGYRPAGLICLGIVFIFVFLIFHFIFAQDTEQTGVCQTKEECESLLREYETKIAEYEKEILKSQKQKETLKNKIEVFKKEIAKLELQIQQSNVMIQDLSFQIKDTKGSIEKTASEIENSKRNLATLLRAIYKADQRSDLEILLSGEKISDYFNHLANLQALNLRNQEILGNIETAKVLLEKQKMTFEEDKRDLEQVLRIQVLQKKENEATKRENDELLKLTKVQYQKLQEEKKTTEKKAAEIRARLLELVGVRKAPTYEEAIYVAQQVSKITGIRPAFLLGILTQESRIGKEVGQCYLRDPQTGMGIKFKKNQIWPRVMKPDWMPLFLEIIEELNRVKGLNLDPYATPISCWIAACVNQNYSVTYDVSVDPEGKITCPIGYQPFGWGGAMGPAQLMPFNWIGSGKYKSKIEAITGKVADPWDFSDAALGAALHLKDCGADLGEREAAACYFGGWGNRNRSYHLRAYADPVMALTQCHQQFIDTGIMSLKCEEKIF
jgi:peptidoglycan hydrolase CwlO-like protein